MWTKTFAYFINKFKLTQNIDHSFDCQNPHYAFIITTSSAFHYNFFHNRDMFVDNFTTREKMKHLHTVTDVCLVYITQHHFICINYKFCENHMTHPRDFAFEEKQKLLWVQNNVVKKYDIKHEWWLKRKIARKKFSSHSRHVTLEMTKNRNFQLS